MKKEIRKIEQYCSVCKKTFEMDVVDEVENNEVLWLKCPGCEGFLPYMVDSGDDDDKDARSSAAGEDVAPEDFSAEDKEAATEYEEEKEYEIEDIIYHRSWNDYGKVVAKEILPGNRRTILVNFGNQGKIRLLEGESLRNSN